MPEVAALQGLWSRSLIEWPDKTRDTRSAVTWLQGPSRFADLRQPPGAPDVSGVRSLADLTETQVTWLVEQEGFAGTLVKTLDVFEWRRRIDFQPPSVLPDRGRLTTADGVMIEEGVALPYVEHWHHAGGDEPTAALELIDDASSGCAGMLVIAGGRFMYVRARLRTFPPGTHLRDHVGPGSAPDDVREALDCEISLGTITADAWRIDRSTLPYRVLNRLGPVIVGNRLSIQDVSGDGTAFGRTWSIVADEGDIERAVGTQGKSA